MFEHMAFKGTQAIGTINWPMEKKALDEVESVYDQLDAEENKGPHADQAKIKSLQAELKAAIDRPTASSSPMSIHGSSRRTAASA